MVSRDGAGDVAVCGACRRSRGESVVEPAMGFCDSVGAVGRQCESVACRAADSGRGAVWLARLTGGQEVAGSSPVAPTLLVQHRGFSTCVG
jgi:hypothetical protein